VGLGAFQGQLSGFESLFLAKRILARLRATSENRWAATKCAQ
jgi:hypothetical protein